MLNFSNHEVYFPVIATMRLTIYLKNQKPKLKNSKTNVKIFSKKTMQCPWCHPYAQTSHQIGEPNQGNFPLLLYSLSYYFPASS